MFINRFYKIKFQLLLSNFAHFEILTKDALKLTNDCKKMHLSLPMYCAKKCKFRFRKNFNIRIIESSLTRSVFLKVGDNDPLDRDLHTRGG